MLVWIWQKLKIYFAKANQLHLLYAIAILVCMLSVFGVIVFLSASTDAPIESLPSPTPSSQFEAVLGAQNPNQQKQQKQQPAGPDKPKPSPSPSPSASPSPSPSPSPSESPSASPSPSTSPSPSPQASNSSDTSGPNISEIKSSNIANNKANVEWKTNEDADEKVEYGKDTSYGKTKENSDKKQTHSVEILELEANTTYHYRITSKDGAGNSTTSGDNTFTTLP